MMIQAFHAREEGILSRRIAGETILVPTRRRAREMALFTLNEVGSYLWERLDGQTSESDLVAQLVRDFEIDAESAAEDTALFLRDLRSAGCVREVQP